MLTQDQTGQVNHLYQDALGSTRLVTDQQGSTQSIIDYDAFGIMGVIQGLSASDFEINGHPSSASFDYKEAIQSFTFNLPRAIGTGIGDWASGYSKTKRQGTKLKGFLIYMPMFKTQIVNNQKTIPTGAKIRFGNEKVPIKLVFGAEKKGARGQLFGLGMQMKNLRQLIRMDHHTPAPDHGGKKGLKPKELGYWIDGDFHYHIMQWH